MHAKLKKCGSRYCPIVLLLLVFGSLFFLGERTQATLAPAGDYQLEDAQLFEDYSILKSCTYELEQKCDIVGVEQGKHASADYSIIPSFSKAEEDVPQTSARNWARYQK